jgi:hypothetical protein
MAGVSAGAGALSASTNSVIAQTDNNFQGTVDWGQVGQQGTIGAVSGFAGGSAGMWAANSSMLVNNIRSPLFRSAVVSPLAAGAGHIAGGTTAGLFQGQSFDVAFSNSFNGIDRSMATGAAIGMSTTIGINYFNGVSPFSGKVMWPKNDGFAGTSENFVVKKGTVIDRYGSEHGGYVSPEGVPFDARGLPQVSKGNYTRYIVNEPLPVVSGQAAGSTWFNSSGGGTQYQLYYNTEVLLRLGYISNYP